MKRELVLEKFAIIANSIETMQYKLLELRQKVNMESDYDLYDAIKTAEDHLSKIWDNIDPDFMAEFDEYYYND